MCSRSKAGEVTIKRGLFGLHVEERERIRTWGGWLHESLVQMVKSDVRARSPLISARAELHSGQQYCHNIMYNQKATQTTGLESDE